jgi:enoyl-CoA hydratase/carnithine racemase
MAGSKVVLIEKQDRIATITVNRPDKMNALNAEVRVSLAMAFEQVRQDDDVRVVILTGSGDKAFVAGADIAEFKGAPAVTRPATSASPATRPSWVSPRPIWASSPAVAARSVCPGWWVRARRCASS